METEVRLATKKAADVEAIRVFAENLRQLLLCSASGTEECPGDRSRFPYRLQSWSAWTGRASFFINDTIYPHQSEKTDRSGQGKGQGLLRKICYRGDRDRQRHSRQGNRDFCQEPSACLQASRIVMVNESGASIYSASEVAREEFPDQDITVRGAVSIGRRLTDPLG